MMWVVAFVAPSEDHCSDFIISISSAVCERIHVWHRFAYFAIPDDLHWCPDSVPVLGIFLCARNDNREKSTKRVKMTLKKWNSAI
jgi:hypothetical protein